MQHAANAYAKVARQATSPRETEASLLIRSAAAIQAIYDDFDNRKYDLEAALAFNRKLWTILSTSATEADNPLPRETKQNIANLALFIFNRSLTLKPAAGRDGLAILVKINRELAAGLRASAG